MTVARALIVGIVLLVAVEAPMAEPARDVVEGMVWQPDERTLRPKGRWHRLGARTLLIQWALVDQRPFVAGAGPLLNLPLPDWERIAAEPWAQEVILGLAGRFSEIEARQHVAQLAAISTHISRLPTPLRVVAWYFPVEVDPTWRTMPDMRQLLRDLPRPLWISVYDHSKLGASRFSQWLASWLPADVGVFFQDGVGVGARNAHHARSYADALVATFGRNRVRIIVEGFRRDGDGFRPASVDELAPQIEAYRGHSLFIFDGPHYISEELVERLGRRLTRRSRH